MSSLNNTSDTTMRHQLSEQVDKKDIKYTSVYVKRGPDDDFKAFMAKISDLRKKYGVSYLNLKTISYLRIPQEHKNAVYNSGISFTGTEFNLKATYSCDQATADKLYMKENRHTFVKTWYNKEVGRLEFSSCLPPRTLENIVKEMFERSTLQFDTNLYNRVYNPKTQQPRSSESHEQVASNVVQAEQHTDQQPKQQFRRVVANTVRPKRVVRERN